MAAAATTAIVPDEAAQPKEAPREPEKVVYAEDVFWPLDRTTECPIHDISTGEQPRVSIITYRSNPSNRTKTREGIVIANIDDFNDNIPMIYNLIKDLGVSDEPIEITVTCLSATTLKEMIIWNRKYGKTVRVVDKTISEQPKEDIELVERIKAQDPKKIENICKFITASVYLNADYFKHIGCFYISRIIKGRTPDEIRAAFNLAHKVDREAGARC